jgi:hypothetical protein
MERILIAVGSARKPKVEAVRDALAVFGRRIDEESDTLRASYACFQTGVENRDYYHLSHSETILNDFARVWRTRHNIPIGTCVDFATKKTASEKNYRPKNSVADWHSFFGRVENWDSHPFPEERWPHSGTSKGTCTQPAR